jgi:hypothetical protein
MAAVGYLCSGHIDVCPVLAATLGCDCLCASKAKVSNHWPLVTDLSILCSFAERELSCTQVFLWVCS